ncbi:putative proline permease [Aspergillus saccharolyticus JOP 1030-1]|uniref:PHD finger and SET domain protein n=1 Tax=Aspergillus saccharolyticus JOP 1030-1 TaxID=1450539 RepID=A0A318ZCD7_9EURO|nr:PHD finger and SET domain protein [Aspergillus saccharolyticus JOP 1030-1]PYH45141.1 PHD finger and SET domain protein [Aspergillus saccharolyticus JOP 1030-1]
MIIPTLGTGLFIGAGQALAVGGPAALVGSYVFISILMYCLATAVAEVAAHQPRTFGTMITHGYQYSSGHLGFALAYLRWYSLALLVPFEVTTAMVSLGQWDPAPSVAVRVTAVTLAIFLFNMLPEREFMRSEILFTGLKLFTTIGFIIVSIYMAIRGMPGTSIRGFRYWHEPGPLSEYLVSGHGGRALGFLQCLLYIVIAFSFIPELIVQRAERRDSETPSSILRSTRLSSLLLFTLYTLSAFMMTFMSPFDEPLLTNNGLGAGASPFVVGIDRAGIRALSTLARALICISSLASGRSFLYHSSRTLCALAETGHAPTLFTARNRLSVPYVAVIASALFSIFGYLSVSVSSSSVHNSLMYFITTSGSISWLGACLVYIRFRRQTSEEGFVQVYQSSIQPYGAYLSIAGCAALPLANCLLMAFPSPPADEAPALSGLKIRNAVPVYISIGTFWMLYLSHRFRTSLTQGFTSFRTVPIDQGQNKVGASSAESSGQRVWWEMARPRKESSAHPVEAGPTMGP